MPILQCILPHDHTYNSDTQFVSYCIERRDQTRFLILQYQDNPEEPEHFATVNVRYDNSQGLFHGRQEQQQNFIRTFNIISRERAIELLNNPEEAVMYHMSLLDKQHLQRAIHIFNATDTIRETGLVQALNRITDQIQTLTSLDINPANFVLFVIDKVAEKKVNRLKFCSIQ